MVRGKRGEENGGYQVRRGAQAGYDRCLGRVAWAAQRAYHRGPVGPLPTYCSIPALNGARVYPYAPTLFA